MSNIDKKFTWGQVIEDHMVGPYTIREFHPRKIRGVEILREVDKDVRHFHGYLEGKDTNESWPSLEHALIGLIVRRFSGANSGAIAYHFMAGFFGQLEEPRSGDTSK